MNRREFLRTAFSALGFSALPGGALFAAPEGWKHGGVPNLVFGVLSDTHLRTRRIGNKLGANWTNRYFISALKYFKSRNADAVVHCGDLAHRGQTRELEFHAEAWRRVFPKGAEPVKLFVTGNHDTEGAAYGTFVAARYPDPVERAKHVLATDMAANWERVWGEKYEPVWHKEVKGYHFFGQHYSVPDEDVIAQLNKWGEEFQLKKGDVPSFFVRHRRPYKDIRKNILRQMGNPVSFFGHNHWSIANWNIPSVYYGRLPVLQCASCEPRGCRALVSDSYISKAKLEGREAAGASRQGYVVLVYDDMLVIERHEFSKGEASLGPDWIMPLSECGKRRTGKWHPLTRVALKKKIGEPQFREGAKLTVFFDRIEKSGKSAGSNPAKPAEPVLKDSATRCLRVKIPLADGNAASRVYAYEVEVSNRRDKLLKAVYAAGCNMGIGQEPDGGITTLEIPVSELPSGKRLTVCVHPLSSLGTRGRAIAGKVELA